MDRVFAGVLAFLIGFTLAGVTGAVTSALGDPSYKIVAVVGDERLNYQPGGVVQQFPTKDACEAHRATDEFKESIASLQVLVLIQTSDAELAESVTSACVEAE